MTVWSEGSVGSGGEAKLPMLESLGTIDLGHWTTAVILERARGLTSSLKRRLSANNLFGSLFKKCYA